MFAFQRDTDREPARARRTGAGSPAHALLGLLVCLGMSTSSHGFEAALLVEAARTQTLSPVIYDGSYRRLEYPGGDVPGGIGVCTDVVIRAFRTQGIDLQQLVHEDMRTSFDDYPALWGLSRPDPNIDHRRVPNLRRYFSRHGAELPVPSPARLEGLEPGDLITWTLPGNLPHIGIVSDRPATGDDHPLILHNIGAGVVEDDILFAFPITGHYRYPVGSSEQPGRGDASADIN